MLRSLCGRSFHAFGGFERRVAQQQKVRENALGSTSQDSQEEKTLWMDPFWVCPKMEDDESLQILYLFKEIEGCGATNHGKGTGHGALRGSAKQPMAQTSAAALGTLRGSNCSGAWPSRVGFSMALWLCSIGNIPKFSCCFPCVPWQFSFKHTQIKSCFLVQF